jgi:hypothetical protein
MQFKNFHINFVTPKLSDDEVRHFNDWWGRYRNGQLEPIVLTGTLDTRSSEEQTPAGPIVDSTAEVLPLKDEHRG